MKIIAPNTFSCPNDLVDEWLPHLGEAEIKCLLLIIRKTFGWHKTYDRISLSQFEKFTGLSRSNVTNAVNGLISKGLIFKEVFGNPGLQETWYSLNIEEDPESKDKNLNKGSSIVTGGGIREKLPGVSQQNTQKTPLQNTIKEPPPTSSLKKSVIAVVPSGLVVGFSGKKEELKPKEPTRQHNHDRIRQDQLYPCLISCQISDQDKWRLTKMFDEQTVVKAVNHCTKESFVPIKTLDASLFYFCKNPQHMTLDKKDQTIEDKKYALEKEKTVKRSGIFEVLNKYVEFHEVGSGGPGIVECIEYGKKGFKALLDEKMIKYRLV